LKRLPSNHRPHPGDPAKPRFTDRTRARREGEILQAALETFNARGCFNTSVEEISRSVGIAKGTVYLHYPSREELFDAALTKGLEELVRTCQRALDAVPAASAGLRAVITELVAGNHRRDPASPEALARLQCCTTWAAPVSRPDVQVERAFLPFVETWKSTGLIDPELDSVWVARVILMLTSLSGGLGSAEPRPGEGRTRVVSTAGSIQRIADQIASLVLRGLAPTKPRRPGAGSDRNNSRLVVNDEAG
jgi:AcrR family transcriptional regulator